MKHMIKRLIRVNMKSFHIPGYRMAVVAKSAHGTRAGQAWIHLTKPHLSSSNLRLFLEIRITFLKVFSTSVCFLQLSRWCRLPCCGIFVLGIRLGIRGLGGRAGRIQQHLC